MTKGFVETTSHALSGFTEDLYALRGTFDLRPTQETFKILCIPLLASALGYLSASSMYHLFQYNFSKKQKPATPRRKPLEQKKAIAEKPATPKNAWNVLSQAKQAMDTAIDIFYGGASISWDVLSSVMAFGAASAATVTAAPIIIPTIAGAMGLQAAINGVSSYLNNQIAKQHDIEFRQKKYQAKLNHLITRLDSIIKSNPHNKEYYEELKAQLTNPENTDETIYAIYQRIKLKHQLSAYYNPTSHDKHDQKGMTQVSKDVQDTIGNHIPTTDAVFSKKQMAWATTYHALNGLFVGAMLVTGIAAICGFLVNPLTTPIAIAAGIAFAAYAGHQAHKDYQARKKEYQEGRERLIEEAAQLPEVHRPKSLITQAPKKEYQKLIENLDQLPKDCRSENFTAQHPTEMPKQNYMPSYRNTIAALNHAICGLSIATAGVSLLQTFVQLTKLASLSIFMATGSVFTLLFARGAYADHKIAQQEARLEALKEEIKIGRAVQKFDEKLTATVFLQQTHQNLTSSAEHAR